MNRIWHIVILTLATTVAGAAAHAALVEVTWVGTVSGGNDRTGTFGGVRSQDFNLAGVGYTAVLRFDTDLGDSTGDATYQQLVGGSSYGNGSIASPVVSASITINGATVLIDSNLFGLCFRRSEAAASAFTGIGIFQTSALGISDTFGGVNEIFNRVRRDDEQLLLPISLTAPYARTFGPGDNVTNSNFQRFDAGELAAANLVPTSLTIAVVPSDGDGDGVPDTLDNCRWFANPGQSDLGGIGVGSTADGIGDACQCGDVSGDGRVTIADATIIQRSQLVPPTALLSFPDRCDVGGPSTCAIADAVIIRRALLVPPTAAITQQCTAALP